MSNPAERAMRAHRPDVRLSTYPLYSPCAQCGYASWAHLAADDHAYVPRDNPPCADAECPSCAACRALMARAHVLRAAHGDDPVYRALDTALGEFARALARYGIGADPPLPRLPDAQ